MVAAAFGPTVDNPMLLGLLVDVSGSMVTSIQSSSGSNRTRLESLRKSLDELISGAARACVEGVGGRISPRLRLFAYGFGFGGPLAFLLGDAGGKVRDLLRLDAASDESAVGIDHLARNWQLYQDQIGGLVPSMLGDTPMAQAFRIAHERVRAEVAARRYTPPPLLFVVSDGVPTDGVAEVRQIAQAMKDDGIIVVSCLLTDEDLTEPRRLYGQRQAHWPDGAALMFDCASPLPPGSPFDAYLIENRWTVDRGCRLFTQINTAEVLEEFSKVVLSPLDTQPAIATHPVRVFVTYSHQDESYLEHDSLLGFLSKALQAEGAEIFTARDLSTGELWDERIRGAIERTDIVLALVSQSFLNSDYCQNVEVAAFLAARRDVGTKIMPVILSPCDWRSHEWLSQTMVRPRNGQTIEVDFDTKGKRDQVFLEILQDLRAAIRQVRQARAAR